MVPEFEGTEQFEGARFHTNQWDHSVPLDGKRVAIIGSGTSAAQVIPAIVDRVAELHVFQRTPHWVLPRPDHVFTRWQRWLFRKRWAQRLLRATIYWTIETRVVGLKYSNLALELIATRTARRILRQQVPNKEVRAALTPEYTIGCKRIILSNTLYPALSSPQTTLHPSDDAIETITSSGVVTRQGTTIELDAIVYATGFRATDGAIPYAVHGEDGLRLHDVWADLPAAYLGTMAARFPNFFTVMGPNTGIGHTSALFMIECQMKYIMRSIHETQNANADAICPTDAAVADYTRMIVREMDRTVWKNGGCQSWYRNSAGHVVAMFPGFSFSYRRLARRFVPKHHRLLRASAP
jgi:cation diffusion facilitator CzcD-associated flavoprotein CzcO